MAPNWFIALPVSAGEWHRSLVAPEGVRLFGEHDLHVTVAFLGGVSEDKALAAWEYASAFSLPALEITLGEVAALGNPRRPSAFSAVLGEGRERVERAMGEAREPMWQAAGARPDTRPPLAHVTFARPQRRATHDQAKRAKRWALDLTLGAARSTLDRIALYTWNEDRATALFRIVQDRQLTSQTADRS